MRKFGCLSIQKNFGSLVTVRPSVRTTSKAMFYVGACYLVLPVHVLLNCYSCHNRVSADQYHMTVSRAQKSTIEITCFLKLSVDKLQVYCFK